MKHLLILLMMLMLGLTACDASKEEIIEREDEVGSAEEEKEDVIQNKVDVLVYFPDATYENVISETVECEEVTEQVLVKLLIEKEVLTSKCKVNSLKQEGTTLEIDVNDGFGDLLRSMGTSGEAMMMKSFVNTFLDAYQCEQVMITENGEILCSGHAEYTEYLTK